MLDVVCMYMLLLYSANGTAHPVSGKPGAQATRMGVPC